MEIGVVTSGAARVAVDDTDRPLIEAAAAALGASASYRAWDDPAVDWAAFDVVVVRSPWDYPERVDEFTGWLASAEAAGVALHNPAAVIRWNLDKRYLADLAGVGVAVVPTAFAATSAEVTAALAGPAGFGDGGRSWISGVDEVVVKPTVSAGCRDTGRFRWGDPAAVALAERILAAGKTVMVQPAVPSVAERGEVACVLIDGALAHAYRKGPLLARGGGLLLDGYQEQERLQRTIHEAELPGAAVQQVEGGLRAAGQERVLGEGEGREADAGDGEDGAAAAAAGDQREDQREEDVELLLDPEAPGVQERQPVGGGAEVVEDGPEPDVRDREGCGEEARRKALELGRGHPGDGEGNAGEEDDGEGGEDAAGAALVEAGDREAAEGEVAGEDAGDEVAGDDEEDVDPEPAAGEGGETHVEQHDGEDGDGAQAVDLAAIAVGGGRGGLRRARRYR